LSPYLKIIGSLCAAVLLTMVLYASIEISIWAYVLLYAAWAAMALDIVLKVKGEAVGHAQEQGSQTALESSIHSLGKALGEQLHSLKILGEQQQVVQAEQQEHHLEALQQVRAPIQTLVEEIQGIPKKLEQMAAQHSTGPVLLELEKQFKLSLQQQSAQGEEQIHALSKHLEALNNLNQNVSQLSNMYQEACKESAAGSLEADSMVQKLEVVSTQTSELLSKVSESVQGITQEGKQTLEAVQSVATGFQEQSSHMLEKIEEGAGERQQVLLQSVQDKQQTLLEEIEKASQGKESQLMETKESLSELVHKMAAAGESLEIAGGIAQANQAGMQASVDMLQGALVEITEHLEKQVGKGEKEDLFLKQLSSTLTAFHEKASEVLIDSATKTREILVGMVGDKPSSQESLDLESKS
jgi:hypothetical protein